MYVVTPRGTGGWRTDCATSEREPADGRRISPAIDKKPDPDLGPFRSFDLHKAVEDELVAGDGRLVAWRLEAELGLAYERRRAGKSNGHDRHSKVNHHATTGPAEEAPDAPGPHRPQQGP